MSLTDTGLQLQELQRTHALVEQENRLLADRNQLLTRVIRPIPAGLRRFLKWLLTQV